MLFACCYLWNGDIRFSLYTPCHNVHHKMAIVLCVSLSYIPCCPLFSVINLRGGGMGRCGGCVVQTLCHLQVGLDACTQNGCSALCVSVVHAMLPYACIHLPQGRGVGEMWRLCSSNLIPLAGWSHHQCTVWLLVTGTFWVPVSPSGHVAFLCVCTSPWMGGGEECSSHPTLPGGWSWCAHTKWRGHSYCLYVCHSVAVQFSCIYPLGPARLLVCHFVLGSVAMHAFDSESMCLCVCKHVAGGGELKVTVSYSKQVKG